MKKAILFTLILSQLVLCKENLNFNVRSISNTIYILVEKNEEIKKAEIEEKMKNIIRHKVIKNETLNKIAKKYKVSINSIKIKNNIKNIDKIHTNQILYIEVGRDI